MLRLYIQDTSKKNWITIWYLVYLVLFTVSYDGKTNLFLYLLLIHFKHIFWTVINCTISCKTIWQMLLYWVCGNLEFKVKKYSIRLIIDSHIIEFNLLKRSYALCLHIFEPNKLMCWRREPSCMYNNPCIFLTYLYWSPSHN